MLSYKLREQTNKQMNEIPGNLCIFRLMQEKTELELLKEGLVRPTMDQDSIEEVKFKSGRVKKKMPIVILDSKENPDMAEYEHWLSNQRIK